MIADSISLLWWVYASLRKQITWDLEETAWSEVLVDLFWSEAEEARGGEGVEVGPQQGGVVGQEGGHGVEEAFLAVEVVVVAGVPLVDTHQLPVQTPAGG